jgi:hypothetical protein
MSSFWILFLLHEACPWGASGKVLGSQRANRIFAKKNFKKL